MIAHLLPLSSLRSFARIVFLVLISAVSPTVYASQFVSSQDSTQPAEGSGDQPGQQKNDENTDDQQRPPRGDEREPRDESGLPDDAFNPMKLYEGNGGGKGADEVGPTVKPGEEGVVHWPYLTVHVKERYIDIEGVIGINDGYLEQVACTPGTRGYESLVIAFARPSHIHAALLLLGLEPGKPGRWEAVAADADHAKGSYRVVPPKGDKVKVTVLYRKVAKKGAEMATGEDDAEKKAEGEEDVKEKVAGKEDDAKEEGAMVEVPVQDWIVDINTGKRFPDGAWVFGGSRMKKDFTDTERYVADLSGSIVGLVTFGDEVLGWNEVWPDEEAVLEPEWVCNTKEMPAWNAKVVLRLRALGSGE